MQGAVAAAAACLLLSPAAGGGTAVDRYSFWWAVGEPSQRENFTVAQFGIHSRSATVTSQFSSHWPHISKDGTEVTNGGIPQLGNLSLHLAMWGAGVNNDKLGGPSRCTNLPTGSVAQV